MCQCDRLTPDPTTGLLAALTEAAVVLVVREVAGFRLVGEWDGSSRLWCTRADCHWQTTVTELPGAVLDAQDHLASDRHRAA